MIKVNVFKQDNKIETINFNTYKVSEIWYKLRKTFDVIELDQVNLFEYNLVIA